MRAEVHEHGGLALDIDNAAKAVLVMRHQITPPVYLGRLLDDRDIEGTTRQVPSPRAGARLFHFTHTTRIACLAAAMAGSSFAAPSIPDPHAQAQAAAAQSSPADGGR
jgi:hypothetical protein